MPESARIIINVWYDTQTHKIQVEMNAIFILLFAVLAAAFLIFKFLKWSKKTNVTLDLESVTLDLPFNLGKYTIKRSYENLEIANKIYIELITRKAAIKIDEENDVIDEVYDSWYNLFTITRNEIKTLPGKALIWKTSSEKLMQLTCDVLNKGLRPHLTKHQAAFRKWFAEELARDENKGKTPQDIQKTYHINDQLNYKALIKSMKEVNTLLIKYAEKLKEFIHSK